MNKFSVKFYLTLLLELALSPILYLSHWSKVLLKKEAFKERRDIECDRVTVSVHEWGGYQMVREKSIKDGVTFNCGLHYQLERFRGNPNVDLIVTLSDCEKHQSISEISAQADIIAVSNEGMDFSGYKATYEKYRELPNRYIILTNSSVNSIQEEFLDSYIQYMNQNKDVGMMGVSYCTKKVQTIIRHNFTPHLQSFFLLTTTDVLDEVVTSNGGVFPGAGIDHKLLLIREGEIKISQLVQKLGYQLAVVNPIDGVPYKFDSYKNWRLPFGDVRQLILTPNRITPIKR